MAGYSFGKGPRASNYNYFVYDTSSSTTDDTTSIEARRQNRIRVENQMRYEWIPREKEVKIKRPHKAFMEYTNDLELDADFIKKLKDDYQEFLRGGVVQEGSEEEIKSQHELMFDPENLDI